jgi:hypothetical protein
MQTARVKPLLILLLLPPASAAAAAPASWPTAEEVAAAYTDFDGEFCRAKIDLCDTGSLPTAPEEIEALACRSWGNSGARCRFEVSYRRCTARFLREPTGANRSWTVARGRPGRGPWTPRMKCRRLRG